ncbi:MAG: STAS domain-containing protein [Candidatus Riflebacteria bacterium]|nr:STAS domain-containing protein [Candidatus Riflebacteria bacterium]
MEFEVTTTEGRRIIASKGDVLHTCAEEFARVIREQVEEGHQVIVLDFSKASMIDSAGISSIVANIGLVKERNARIILGGCNPTIQKVFQLIGFKQHFAVTGTLAEALKA